MDADVPEPGSKAVFFRRIPVAALGAVLLAGGLLGLGGTVWAVKRFHARSATRAVQQAAQAAEQGHFDEAFTLLASACDAQPGYPDHAKRAAMAALAAGRVPEAVSYARRAWDAGLRDEEVLGALLAGEAGTEAGDEGIRRAEALISALSSQPARLRMRVRVLVAHGQLDEARRVLTELIGIEPSGVAVAALAELMLRQKAGAQALELLQYHRAAGRLDADGYRLLALAQAEADLAHPDPTRRGSVLEIIAEARHRGMIDDALRFDEAQYLIANHDLRAAATTLAEIGPGRTDLEARLLEAWVLASLGRAGDWKAPDRQRFGGAAGEALSLVAQALVGASPADGIFSLQKAERLIGDRPALDLLIARLMVARGERESALDRYRAVKGLLAYAPVVLLEQAEILAVLGRRDAAVGLVLTVHRLHGPTRRSLLLFDALAGGMVGTDVIEAMRRIAASQSNDRTLAALSADLARRQLATSSPAEEGLSPAERAVADDVRTHLGRREYETALAGIDGAKLPVAVSESLRGFALQGLGRHQEALVAFAAARQSQQPANLHLSEALSALAIHATASAVAAASRAQETLPADPTVWQVLVSALIQDGKAAEAIVRLDGAAAADLDQAQKDALRGLALAAAGRSAEALAAARAALAVQPRHALALPLAIDLALAEGRNDEAIALLQGVDIQADPTLLLRRIAVHLARGDHQSALSDLELVPPALRGQVDGDALRIRLLAATGDVREAQRALGALPDGFPPGRRALLSAIVQERAGRRPAAIFLLREHLDDAEAAFAWARMSLAEDAHAAIAAPLAGGRLPAEALRRIAGLVAGHERWDEAASIADQARTQAPQDPLVLNDWAWYSAQAGASLPVAVEAALNACRLMEGHPVPLETAALLLVRADRAGEAVSLLSAHSQAVERSPQLAHAQAQALAAAGRVGEARAAYQSLLERFPAGAAWPMRESREAVLAEQATLKP
jgi:tetratricopeptide (TPR) repeat protein